MREAVIVSTARTPIGRAFRGAFNNIKSPTLLGHAIMHAVQRAGIDPGEIDDVVIGTVLGAGTAGKNIARNASLAAGLPITVAAQTIDRQCSSGLMAISTAAKQIIVDGMAVAVGGGQENISAVQTPYFDWVSREADPEVIARAEHAYMPMLMTAEFVSRRYKISRTAQDEYALLSQQRTAAAQAANLFADEIVPLPSTMAIIDKETKAVQYRATRLDKDEGNRPETTRADLSIEVRKWLQKQPASEWRPQTLRDTTRGDLRVEVIHRHVWLWDKHGPTAHRWHLMVRREVNSPATIKYTLSNADEQTSVNKLAQMQAQRFWIERAFQDAKSHIGMADYQARKWQSWHRHMALVMMAMQFMLETRIKNAELLPLLTCYDIQILIATTMPDRRSDADEVIRQLHERHRKRQASIDSAHLNETRNSLI